jgi:hypothetical protein
MKEGIDGYEATLLPSQLAKPNERTLTIVGLLLLVTIELSVTFGRHITDGERKEKPRVNARSLRLLFT